MDIPTSTLLPWIPALPLIAALVTAILGPRVLRDKSHWPTIVALVLATVCSLVLLVRVGRQDSATSAESLVTLWTWADVTGAFPEQSQDGNAAKAALDLRVDIVLRADALTAMMLTMVTFISSLVAIFSVGYMHGERGYWRFFSYIGLFVFSMTMLVSVSNFVLLFVFWEAVGVCSYLLIGFWYAKPAAAAAGKKAFLVNRVGDLGFTLALFLIWVTFGSLDFHDTPVPSAGDNAGSQSVVRADVHPGVLGEARIGAGDYAEGQHGPAILLAICLLLLVGACGKTAQFPLHVWLADAMEGPTPVSALIHAATMVTAGVYMITRCTPLFVASPDAQLIVSIVGAVTALLAALIALTQYDLKRVLAFSTISQLGYMFVALGVGTLAGISAAMFHLFTHAFFKALLFLGAGSVMHAMGNVIDMRRFGGLRRIMPITHWTFLIGCLALSGIPPFSGFWSKDSIVASVHDRVHELEHDSHDNAQREAGAPVAGDSLAGGDPRKTGPEAAARHEIATRHETVPAAVSPLGITNHDRAWAYELVYYSALLTALLTAYYTFRAFLMTFYGPLRVPEQAGEHAHESPISMSGPLVVLSAFAALAGLSLDWTPWSGIGMGNHVFASYISATPSLSHGPVAATSGLDRFHWNVALISASIAASGVGLAVVHFRLRGSSAVRGLDRVFDQKLVPQFLEVSVRRLSENKFYVDEIYGALIVRPLLWLASLSYTVDRQAIDRLVNIVGFVPRSVGGVMRSLQVGLVQFYGLAMVLVVAIVVAVKLIWSSG